MEGFLSAKECINQYVENIPGKVRQKLSVVFGKGILAGAMIAIGASASSVAAHNIQNVGVARLIAGAVFPVGLMMVILLGAELFTGDCMVLTGVIGKKLSALKGMLFLLTVYVGNFVGSLIMVILIYLSGQYEYSGKLLGAYTIKVALGKANVSFVQGVSSGILCNILVCAAVLMAMCAKDISGKLLSSFFVILAFVTSGYEHCVANMYYITAGLVCKMNPSYVEAAINSYGFTNEQIAGLSIKNFLITNMIPVTVGNIVGGALFVAIPLYLLNNAKK